MKSLLGRLGVILIGLAIFSYVEVWGADWKFYNEDKTRSYYYDRASIVKPSKDVIRVWHKDIIKGQKDNLEEELKVKGRLVKVIMWLDEINCSERRIRTWQCMTYDNKMELLEVVSYTTLELSPKWSEISPEAVQEKLYKQVCR